MPDLAYELHDLVLTLDRAAEQRLRPLRLSYRRLLALIVVDEHPDLTSRDLAGALGVTPPAAGALVRDLLDRGLLADVAAPGSGNRRALRRTDAGAQLAGAATDRLGGALDDAVRGLGLDPDELAETIRAVHAAVRDPAVDRPEPATGAATALVPEAATAGRQELS